MALSFGFYNDAALSSPATLASILQRDDGATGPVDRVVYFGSESANRQCQAASNPGVDAITIGITDADAGNGQPATAIKLASSSVGLNTATAGDPLSLGTSVASGAANSVAVYFRVEDQTSMAGTYTDLSLETNSLVESDA